MGGVFGVIREETPKYEEVEKNEKFEIRKYGPVLVAETTFEGQPGQSKGNESAFFTLAGYIGVLSAPKNVKRGTEGQGAEGEKIAMTAPVVMKEAAPGAADGEKIAMTAPVIMAETGSPKEGAADATSVMQFVLPSKFTMETVPVPTDPRVAVKEVPGKTVGAMVFTGSWDRNEVREKAAQLKAALEAAGHKPKEPYMSAFYNSPFTISFFRRNEVWYELDV